MKCYQCVNWFNIKYDGLIANGNCRVAPVVQFRAETKLIGGFTATTKCHYPESFKHESPEEISLRQEKMRKSYEKSNRFNFVMCTFVL